MNKSLLTILSLLVGIAIACQRSGTTSDWQPNWQTIPDASKKAKPQLSPSITFADAYLGFIPILDNDEQKRLNEQDIHRKELFIQAFRRVPECKGITFMQTNPRQADFDIQVFSGLDGRKGKWQWVLYRTDNSARLAFGEEADLNALTKRVCEAVHDNIESTGGRVE